MLLSITLEVVTSKSLRRLENAAVSSFQREELNKEASALAGGYTRMIRVSLSSLLAVLELTTTCLGLGSGRVLSKASGIRSACSGLIKVMPTRVMLSARGVLS